MLSTDALVKEPSATKSVIGLSIHKTLKSVIQQLSVLTLSVKTTLWRTQQNRTSIYLLLSRQSKFVRKLQNFCKVISCYCKKTKQEAVKWAKVFKLHRHKLPSSLVVSWEEHLKTFECLDRTGGRLTEWLQIRLFSTWRSLAWGNLAYR